MPRLSSWFSKLQAFYRIMLPLISLSLAGGQALPKLDPQSLGSSNSFHPPQHPPPKKKDWSFLYLNNEKSAGNLQCIILPNLVRGVCARTETSGIAQGQPSPYSTIFFFLIQEKERRKRRDKEKERKKDILKAMKSSLKHEPIYL